MISEEIIKKAKNFIYLSEQLTTSKEEMLIKLNMELLINICDEINDINLRLKYLNNNMFNINTKLLNIEGEINDDKGNSSSKN